MTTLKDIALRALRIIQVIPWNETSIEDSMQNIIIQALEEEISSSSVSSLFQFKNINETFELDKNKNEYSIGPGLDFDTITPYKINFAFLSDSSGNTTSKIDVIISQEEFIENRTWDLFPLPSKIYYQLISEVYGKIYLNSTLPQNFSNIQIFSSKNLIQLPITTLDTEINIPYYYRKALAFTLALTLAPEFETELSESNLANINAAIENVKSMSMATEVSSVGVEFDLRYPFYRGYY